MHTITQRKRQPFSRGSPRPRGYVHQSFASSFILIGEKNITSSDTTSAIFLTAILFTERHIQQYNLPPS